jgi:hypothetical protein
MKRGDTVLLNGQPVTIVQGDNQGIRYLVRTQKGHTIPADHRQLTPMISSSMQPAAGPPLGDVPGAGPTPSQKGVHKTKLDVINKLPDVRLPPKGVPAQPRPVQQSSGVPGGPEAQIREAMAKLQPNDFFGIAQVFQLAVSHGVVTEPDVARELSESTSNVMNWARGALPIPPAVQQDLLGYISTSLGTWRANLTEAEREAAQAAALGMRTPGAQGLTNAVTQAVEQLAGKRVKVIEVLGQTLTVEIAQRGEEFVGEIPGMNVRARAENDIDLMLDLKAQATYAIENPQGLAETEASVGVPDLPGVEDGTPTVSTVPEPADVGSEQPVASESRAAEETSSPGPLPAVEAPKPPLQEPLPQLPEVSRAPSVDDALSLIAQIERIRKG